MWTYRLPADGVGQVDVRLVARYEFHQIGMAVHGGEVDAFSVMRTAHTHGVVMRSVASSICATNGYRVNGGGS